MLKSLFDYLEPRLTLEEWNRFVTIQHTIRNTLSGKTRWALANALLAAVASRNPDGRLDGVFTEIQNWKYGNYNSNILSTTSIDDSDLFATA